MTATRTRKTIRKPAPVFAPLRTRRDFELALSELDYWTDLDPKEGTAEYDRMELLTILIAAYEEDKLPAFQPASPRELVVFMAEQKGINSSALAELLGGRSRLSEFLAGARKLSKSQILRLRDKLGIPADLLLN